MSSIKKYIYSSFRHIIASHQFSLDSFQLKNFPSKTDKKKKQNPKKALRLCALDPKMICPTMTHQSLFRMGNICKLLIKTSLFKSSSKTDSPRLSNISSLFIFHIRICNSLYNPLRNHSSYSLLNAN